MAAIMFGIVNASVQYTAENEEAGEAGFGRTTLGAFLYAWESILGPGSWAAWARLGLGELFVGSTGVSCLASQPEGDSPFAEAQP